MSPERPPTKVRAPKVVREKRGWRVALGAVSHRLGHRSEWWAAALLMARGYQILGFRLKTRAGAAFIIPQLGYDLRKSHELISFLRESGITLPLVGHIRVLNPGAARHQRSECALHHPIDRHTGQGLAKVL